MLAVSSFLNGLTPDPPFLCKPEKIIVLLKKKSTTTKKEPKTKKEKTKHLNCCTFLRKQLFWCLTVSCM